MELLATLSDDDSDESEVSVAVELLSDDSDVEAPPM